jgi:hypothetical protein
MYPCRQSDDICHDSLSTILDYHYEHPGLQISAIYELIFSLRVCTKDYGGIIVLAVSSHHALIAQLLFVYTMTFSECFACHDDLNTTQGHKSLTILEVYFGGDSFTIRVSKTEVMRIPAAYNALVISKFSMRTVF